VDETWVNDKCSRNYCKKNPAADALANFFAVLWYRRIVCLLQSLVWFANGWLWCVASPNAPSCRPAGSKSPAYRLGLVDRRLTMIRYSRWRCAVWLGKFSRARCPGDEAYLRTRFRDRVASDFTILMPRFTCIRRCRWLELQNSILWHSKTGNHF